VETKVLIQFERASQQSKRVLHLPEEGSRTRFGNIEILENNLDTG
jgi:hypothetical protein